MVRRIVAGLVALVLAAVGAVLVVAYAQGADERALAGQETVDVLVATEPASEGATAGSLKDTVELKPVPKSVLVAGAVADLKDVEGKLLTADLAAGEQLHAGNFATEEELRARGTAPLPEGVENLHQVTIPLDKARALGGNVAVGDTVGVFMSFDVSEVSGYVMDGEGRIERQESDTDDDSGSEGSAKDISMTHLTLHKVPVVRVEGAHVEPPARAQDDEESPEKTAQDTLFVTLALPAPDAERLVFGMEWGQVWLSMEPESADENGTEVVVVTIPDTARNVLQ